MDEMTQGGLVVWTPDPASPLLEVQEDERNVAATVTVTPDATVPANPTSLTWKTDLPLPEQVVIETSGTTLTLRAPNMLGLFVPKKLRYRLNGPAVQFGEAKNWDDLPVNAEIVEFRPYPFGRRVILLTVTADTGHEAIYEIVVYANFTTGRDALVKAVNARRKHV